MHIEEVYDIISCFDTGTNVFETMKEYGNEWIYLYQ